MHVVGNCLCVGPVRDESSMKCALSKTRLLNVYEKLKHGALARVGINLLKNVFCIFLAGYIQ